MWNIYICKHIIGYGLHATLYYLFLQVEKYAGDRSHEDLKKFVVTMMGREDQEGGQKEQRDEPQPPVVVLTSENFENAVEKGTSMVKFFAPWYGSCWLVFLSLNYVAGSGMFLFFSFSWLSLSHWADNKLFDWYNISVNIIMMRSVGVKCLIILWYI